jgi:hypothetical protein
MWTEHKVDGDLAKQLRRELRMYRREKGKGGHKFSFKDLRAIYAPDTDDVEHAIVTHNTDSAWLHFWRHQTRGWMQQQPYYSQDEAYQAVEAFEPYEPKPPPAGSHLRSDETYVVGGMPDRPGSIKVKTSSPWTTQQLNDIFHRLGLNPTVQ